MQTMNTISNSYFDTMSEIGDCNTNILYTWFGNTQKFDYAHRLGLVIALYIFKVLATPKETSTTKASDILWHCMMNQNLKTKMRGLYLVTDEIRSVQVRFAKEYETVKNCMELLHHKTEQALFPNP